MIKSIQTTHGLKQMDLFVDTVNVYLTAKPVAGKCSCFGKYSGPCLGDVFEFRTVNSCFRHHLGKSFGIEFDYFTSMVVLAQIQGERRRQLSLSDEHIPIHDGDKP